jgi:hypothetical protein
MAAEKIQDYIALNDHLGSPFFWSYRPKDDKEIDEIVAKLARILTQDDDLVGLEYMPRSRNIKISGTKSEQATHRNTCFELMVLVDKDLAAKPDPHDNVRAINHSARVPWENVGTKIEIGGVKYTTKGSTKDAESRGKRKVNSKQTLHVGGNHFRKRDGHLEVLRKQTEAVEILGVSVDSLDLEKIRQKCDGLGGSLTKAARVPGGAGAGASRAM